jgi:hypothetical protein
VTTQRQLPSTHIQLLNPSHTDDSMMPHFENQPGPWSASSPINAEGRKRALSDEIPGISQYPKDRHWDDKMQEALKKIGTPEGQEESGDERSKRAKRRRREKKRTSTTPSKSRTSDDKHQKDSDGRGSGQGGGQAVMAS